MQWLPTAITAFLGILAAFSEPIQGFISAHPMAGVVLGAVYAIVKGLLPSPVAK